MAGFRAAFSNGVVEEIRNSKRPYTHAWCATGPRPDVSPAAQWIMKGFSSSEAGAQRNMPMDIKRFQKTSPTFTQVVPVQVMA